VSSLQDTNKGILVAYIEISAEVELYPFSKATHYTNGTGQSFRPQRLSSADCVRRIHHVVVITSRGIY